MTARKTTRTAAQIAASLTANAQSYREGGISEAEAEDQAAADWAAATSARTKAEVSRILRDDYHANAKGEPLHPLDERTIQGRDGKMYPAVLRVEPYAGIWRVQNHPELPTFSLQSGPEEWATYWVPGARVEFVDRAPEAPEEPFCEHCGKRIQSDPVTFHSEGKAAQHYHPHHASTHFHKKQ